MKNSKLVRMLHVDGLFSEGQKTMERSAFGRPTATDCTILAGSKSTREHTENKPINNHILLCC